MDNSPLKSEIVMLANKINMLKTESKAIVIDFIFYLGFGLHVDDPLEKLLFQLPYNERLAIMYITNYFLTKEA